MASSVSAGPTNAPPTNWIDIDQDPLGHAARRVAINGTLEVWARPLEDGTQAVGLFNRGDHDASVSARWIDLSRRSLGLPRLRARHA